MQRELVKERQHKQNKETSFNTAVYLSNPTLQISFLYKCLSLATGLLLVCPVCFCHLSTLVKTLPYLLCLPSWTAERLCVNVRVNNSIFHTYSNLFFISKTKC